MHKAFLYHLMELWCGILQFAFSAEARKRQKRKQNQLTDDSSAVKKEANILLWGFGAQELKNSPCLLF